MKTAKISSTILAAQTKFVRISSEEENLARKLQQAGIKRFAQAGEEV